MIPCLVLLFMNIFSPSPTLPVPNVFSPYAIPSPSEINQFLSFFTTSTSKHETLQAIESDWKPEYEVLLIEVAYLLRDPVTSEIIRTLEKKTDQNFGYDFNAWYEWLWNKEQAVLPDYDNFKAQLYRPIDPRFTKYFLDRKNTSTIRLDEIRWGGVKQDGIPPLRSPHMLEANDAGYLDDDDIVFGIVINGDVRAYPKRILAWHEMLVDTVGGIPVAGVYCTLCGTVILYKTRHNGIDHHLGTSGFLYRSNKLMYDQATQSLWSTMEGKPVLGPMAGKGIELEYYSVVTTTWGEWKRRHPETRVLDIQTGFARDYDEGAAYRDYFSTDDLMFNTPFKNESLRNKDEIVALRHPDYPNDQLAIAAEFLEDNPVYTNRIGDLDLVVLTDQSGANRVYRTDGVRFRTYDQQDEAIDSTGTTWRVTERNLVAADGRALDRLSSFRAFWFGWYAAFPRTRLVK